MPTEKQMANLKKFSSEQLRENGRKGGKASGEKRAMLKSFREIDAETTTSDERTAMLRRLKDMAMRGNIKALELYLKIIGEYETKVTAQVTDNTRDPLRSLSLEQIKELIEDA